MTSYLKPERIAGEIINLYEQYGTAEYIREKISLAEHMSQAADLASREGYDDEIILAAFLHDIGHLLPVHDENESMNGYGTIDHEKLGAYYLGKLGFSKKLCDLIRSHVNAKRYLTWSNPGYYKKLSSASKQTLEYQGGKMDEEEAVEFENDPFFPLYIKMREWDEAAKKENQHLYSPGRYWEMMIEHLVLQQERADKERVNIVGLNI